MIPAANNSQMVNGRNSLIGPSSCPSKYAITHTPLAPTRTASRKSSVGSICNESPATTTALNAQKDQSLSAAIPVTGKTVLSPANAALKLIEYGVSSSRRIASQATNATASATAITAK